MAKKKGNSSRAPKPIPAAKPRASAPKASARRVSAPKASTSKAKVVTAAKTAASAGSFTKNNAKDLRKAGVSKERIQTIRGKSQQTAAQQQQAPTSTYKNSAGDTIRTSPGEMPADVAARAKELGIKPTFVPGLMEPGQKGYNAETGGGNWVFAQGKVDPEQLRAWYRGDPNNGTDKALDGKNRSDFTLDGLYGQYSQPSSTAASVSAETAAAPGRIKRKNSIGKNLKIAAGTNGVLSNKELLSISKKNKRDPEKILEKAVGKGMMIGSAVVNKYQRGKYTDPGLSMARQALPGFAMAAGKDSSILRQIRNAGKQDKGSALFVGSKGSTATTLPRKLGLGNDYRAPGGNLPTDTGTQSNPAPEPTAVTDSFAPETFVPPVEETQSDPGVGMMSGGGMGAAGANKLGRAKSRLRKLGIYGRGTGLLGRGLQYGNVLNA